jgi:hypothetical protein
MRTEDGRDLDEAIEEMEQEIKLLRARGDEWRIKEDLAQREIEEARRLLFSAPISADKEWSTRVVAFLNRTNPAVDRTQPELKP